MGSSAVCDGIGTSLFPRLRPASFFIPEERIKTREDRLVVLNRIAEAAIDQQRGKHPQYVFIFNGKPVRSMDNTACKVTRGKVGLPHVRIHYLLHTFGRRRRAAGVSFDDRQDLLGHKFGRITTDYSRPELENLIEAANWVCPVGGHKMPTTVLLRKKIPLRLVSNRAGGLLLFGSPGSTRTCNLVVNSRPNGG